MHSFVFLVCWTQNILYSLFKTWIVLFQSIFFSSAYSLSLFHSSALTLQISLCFWKFHFQYLNLIVCWRICFVLYMYGVCSSNRYYGIYVCYVGWFYSTTASFNVICVPYGFKSAQAAQSHWINMCVFSWLTSNYHIEPKTLEREHSAVPRCNGQYDISSGYLLHKFSCIFK